jgi:hypothetical protein
MLVLQTAVGLGVHFENNCEDVISLFWDSFGFSQDSNGLVFMGEIPPGVEHEVDVFFFFSFCLFI